MKPSSTLVTCNSLVITWMRSGSAVECRTLDRHLVVMLRHDNTRSFAGVRLGSAVTKVLVCGKCGQSPPLPSPPLLSLPSPPLPSPPLPSPPLPCPALPCPALPCPPLPCPALPLPSPPLPSLPSPPLPSPPSPPSLPPSRVPNLIKLGPAVWPKLQPAEARECSAALAISEWTRRLSAMLIIARRKKLFWKRRITRAVIRIGTNEWPIAHPTG